MRESQYQSIYVVKGDALAIFIDKVLFAFEDDFILGIEGIADRHHLALEVWVVRECASGEPCAAGPIHGGAIVGVLLASVAPNGVVDYVFAAELDFVAEESASTDLVDHTTTNTTTVDHYSVGVVLIVDADDFASELGCGIAVVAEAVDCSGVAAFAREDHGGVHAEAGDVDAKGERLMAINEDLAGHGFVDSGGGEELHQAFAGELA